jgi:hypothetical protein
LDSGIARPGLLDFPHDGHGHLHRIADNSKKV